MTITLQDRKIQMIESDRDQAQKELIDIMTWAIKRLTDELERLKTHNEVETFLPTNISSNLSQRHSTFLAKAEGVRVAHLLRGE